MYALINLVSRDLIGPFYEFTDAEITMEELNFDPEVWGIWYMADPKKVNR